MLREYPGSRVLLTQPAAVPKTTGPKSKKFSCTVFSGEKGRVSPTPSPRIAPQVSFTNQLRLPETGIGRDHDFIRNDKVWFCFKNKLHFHQRSGFLVIKPHRKHWMIFADDFKSRAYLKGGGEGEWAAG